MNHGKTAGKTAKRCAATRKSKGTTDKSKGRGRRIPAYVRDDWASDPNVIRSYVAFEQMDGKRAIDTLDACAVAMGLTSRGDALAALLADRLGQPIAADVSPDKVNGGYFNAPCLTYAVAHIGGTGWGLFRAEGIGRRMDASELVIALVEEASNGLIIRGEAA